MLGMLWEVTDRDTDILTTEFLSNWLPTAAPIHWRFMDLTAWKKSEKGNKLFFSTFHFLMFFFYVLVEFPTETVPSYNKRDNEKYLKSPEKDMLKSLVLAKKRVMFAHTKAGCVVRGLPVRLL